MEKVTQNLLVLEEILDINFYEKYGGVKVVLTGSYLYYYYDTGWVDGLPESSTALTIVPRFPVATRTTLEYCEAEVQRLFEEELMEQQSAEEARTARLLGEERVRVLSPL